MGLSGYPYDPPTLPLFKSLQYQLSRLLGGPQRTFWRRESGIKPWTIQPSPLPSTKLMLFLAF
jgi:hypothetical protein